MPEETNFETYKIIKLGRRDRILYLKPPNQTKENAAERIQELETEGEYVDNMVLFYKDEEGNIEMKLVATFKTENPNLFHG